MAADATDQAGVSASSARSNRTFDRSMTGFDVISCSSRLVAGDAIPTSACICPPPDCSRKFQAAQAAGAQVVVLDTLAPAATALVLLDAANIGYHPTFLDTFRLSADPVTVGNLIKQFSAGKASPGLENGLITQDYLPSASDLTSPWIRLFRAIHDTYEPQAPFDNMTVHGMAAAYTFTRALEAGGPEPTRQSIVAAVNFGAVDFGGPGLVPLAA